MRSRSPKLRLQRCTSIEEINYRIFVSLTFVFGAKDLDFLVPCKNTRTVTLAESAGSLVSGLFVGLTILSFDNRPVDSGY